jgi:hypothetical protein
MTMVLFLAQLARNGVDLRQLQAHQVLLPHGDLNSPSLTILIGIV